MTDLLIEPLDLWLFRDGRPFTAGEDHVAHSLFPPTPLTLYGVLRTKLLVDRATQMGIDGPLTPETVGQLVGAPDDFQRFRLRGPWIARNEFADRWTRLVPAPRDVIRRPPADDLALLGPAALPLPGLASNTPVGLLWPPAGTAGLASVREAWLTEEALEQYLLGLPPPGIVQADAQFARETRRGVQLDRGTRTAETGRLYTVEFVRLRPGVGLAAEIEGVAFDTNSGLLGVGGEGRGGRYRRVTFARRDWSAVGRQVAESGRAKLVLATPAFFAGGWHPGCVDLSAGEWRLPGGERLSLVGAAVGPPQSIGGFDVVNRRPRPMRRAVPAGSVYYVREQTPGDAAAFFDAYHLACCSDELGGIGFGLAFVGRWDYV